MSLQFMKPKNALPRRPFNLIKMTEKGITERPVTNPILEQAINKAVY